MNRPLDYQGRVVLPAEIRKYLRIEPEDLLDITLIGRKIILTPIKAICVVCAEPQTPTDFMGFGICKTCWHQIQETMQECDEDEHERE